MAPRARLPLSKESSAWSDLSSRADPAPAACFSRVRGKHVVRATSHDHDSRFARAAGSETSTVGHVPRLSLLASTLVASRPSPTLVAPQILRPKTQASSAAATTARCPAKACRSTWHTLLTAPCKPSWTTSPFISLLYIGSPRTLFLCSLISQAILS